MIFNLILKDIKAYKNTIFLKIFLLWLFFSAVFFFKLYPWDVYMMHACMTIAFANSIFSFSEKNRNTEIMTCSLPVSRSAIVKARYFTTAVIAFAGIILWFLFAYFADFFYTNAVIDFSQIFNLKVLFIVLFFISIHSGIFLPAVFRFRLFGTIITFVAAIVTAITATALLFRPDKRSFTPYFEAGDFLPVTVLIIFMVLAIFISMLLSALIYNKRDL
ncbi:hypothetical protein AMJ80_03690 [bacterium SM23_31]|nr:MAG: hypothetical protein AMJ80_03690 [bacterium SM23_31]